jgi:hypothetical protein
LTRYENREQERQEYRGDVFYAVWRSGGDPDRVDYDRVSDRFYDGYSAEEAAHSELRSQRPTEPVSDEPEYPIQDYSGEIPDNE